MTKHLGDALSSSVLFKRLRQIADRIDFSGYPAQPGKGSDVMLQYVDSYLPQNPYLPSLGPVGVPSPLRRAVWRRIYSRFWKFKRTNLFPTYDVLINMPGPYANYDERWWPALSDLDIATSLGIPFIFPCNSIGPLDDWQVERTKEADLVVAREPATHQYLTRVGIDSYPSADYGFLFDLNSVKWIDYTPQFGPDYVVLFFRYNNLALSSISREGDRIYYGNNEFIDLQGREVVFSTSSVVSDQKFIPQVAWKCRGQILLCQSVDELLSIIRGASEVISDRYHPCVCGLLLNKQTTIVENKEPHKMHGLQILQDDYTLSEIISLAESGIERVMSFLASIL